MEEIFEMMGILVVYDLAIWAFSIAMYVLMSLGLYTIAKRRGIEHAWLAWLPVGSTWILGSIADHYRKVTRGERKNRRTVMVVLSAVVFLLALIVIFTMFGSVFELIMDMEYGHYDEEEVVLEFIAGMFSSVGLSLLMSGAAIAMTVLQYICLYELFESCDPQNKTLYLLLSIFLGVSSILIFLCRSKDQGMYPPPPRPPMGYMPPQPPYGQPYYPQPPCGQPPYQPPQYQPPVQPPAPPEATEGDQ